MRKRVFCSEKPDLDHTATWRQANKTWSTSYNVQEFRWEWLWRLDFFRSILRSFVPNEFIHFLKNVEVLGSYAENQKISAIRKIYHRGIIIPMLNVENLWYLFHPQIFSFFIPTHFYSKIRKDYVSFEQGINPMIAEKLTAEKSRDYMNARRVAKEYEAITRGLDRGFLSLPPCGSIEEIKQVWIRDSEKRLIRFFVD